MCHYQHLSDGPNQPASNFLHVFWSDVSFQRHRTITNGVPPTLERWTKQSSTQFTTSPNGVQLQMACHQHLSDGPNKLASNSLLHQSAFDATCNSSNQTTTQGVPPSTLERWTKPTSKQFPTCLLEQRFIQATPNNYNWRATNARVMDQTNQTARNSLLHQR